MQPLIVTAHDEFKKLKISSFKEMKTSNFN